MSQITEAAPTQRELGGAVSKIAQTKQFSRDVKAEMKKVTWPTREEVKGTTVVVLIAVFFFGFFLWGVDIVISLILKTLMDLVK